jgi:hypothetical protein
VTALTRLALRLVTLLPLTGGCGVFDDSCGPETRDVTASTAGSTSAGADHAQVMLTQDRGNPGSFYWLAQSAAMLPGEVDSFPLHEHVVAARLLDSGDEPALLFELPVGPIEGQPSVGGELVPYAGPISFEALFALVREGRAALELETDIPGGELLIRPLLTVVFRDWRRVPCD